MIRDGPGGSVTVHRPSAPVVTDAASLKTSEPLSGAVMTATGWPASGRPALLISSPCTLTGRPKATFARLASRDVDLVQLRRSAPSRCPVARATSRGRPRLDSEHYETPRRAANGPSIGDRHRGLGGAMPKDSGGRRELRPASTA